MKKLLLILSSLMIYPWALARTDHADLEPIRLLPHQQEVISYLDKNPKLKGLILYHALGAGKTITALYYAKQHKFKTVILVPEVLKAHWLSEIKKVGLDLAAVELLSFTTQQDIQRVKGMDFSTSLVIIDEVQKFVELVRLSPDSAYMDSYWQLSKAGKSILLTGTPVYNDATDVAFIGNLASGKEVFPFHPDEFRSTYMRINTATSLFRGYLSESKLMTSALPLYASLLGTSLIVVSGTAMTLPLVTMAGVAGLNYANELYPINKVTFRQFDANLFAGFANQHISFYEAQESEKKDYPTTSIHSKRVHYTRGQVRFFMDFVDGVLSRENIKLLLKDYPYQYSEAKLYINAAKIQQDILARPDAGREIGNLSLPGEHGLEVPPKFVAIENLIRQNKGKTAVYSSYYHNGIVLFADYLKSKSLEFEILHPDVGVAEVARVIENFNSGKNKILLIHPEITEGISLVGVEQLHILEPVKNSALEKQIIGRSVRYHSHSQLPADRRHVNVYLWEAKVAYSHMTWPSDAGLERREQWRKRYREVNPNLWTNGISQLDRQFFKKDETPDYKVNHTKDQIEGDMESFRLVASDYSMERKDAKPNNSLTLSSELTSQFAVPLLYFNGSFDRSFSLSSTKDGSDVIEVTGRKSIDFSIEIPHHDRLSLGFGMRASSGEAHLLTEDMQMSLDSFDMDLGFLSRVHYEFPALSNASFYWKNELDANIFLFAPAFGLGLGVREAVGVQTFLSKHFGVSLEVGYEGKILKDTLSSVSKSEAAEAARHLEAIKNISSMTAAHPYIAVGIFSSYY